MASREEYSKSDDEGTHDYKPGGYHPIKVGDVLNKYIIDMKLGYGNFSTVWLATNKETNQSVAVKVQKSESECRYMALSEARYLKKCKGMDCVVQLLDSFYVNGPNGKHFCFVFNRFDDDLLEITEGLSYKLTRYMARKILIGLKGLHSIGLIHTDLKSENILVATDTKYNIGNIRYNRENAPPETIESLEYKIRHTTRGKSTKKRLKEKIKKLIKDPPPPFTPKDEVNDMCMEDYEVAADNNTLRVCVADIGNACWIDKQYSDDITCSKYRAPEVIVGYPYNQSVDLWAYACIVYEIAAGESLFSAKDDDRHLGEMMSFFGEFPKGLIKKGEFAMEFFNKKNKFKNRIHKEDFKHEVFSLTEFTDIENEVFIDFLRSLFQLHPQNRPSIDKLLDHPFLFV